MNAMSPTSLTAETSLTPSHPDAELIAACTAFSALDEEFRATGFSHRPYSPEQDAADKEQDRIVGEQTPLVNQMRDLRALTLDGCVARARSLVMNNPDLLQEDGASHDRVMLAALLRDLTAGPTGQNARFPSDRPRVGSGNPDEALSLLGEQFAVAAAAEAIAYDLLDDDGEGPARKIVDAQTHVMEVLAEAIGGTRAATLDGVMVKIRAILHLVGKGNSQSVERDDFIFKSETSIVEDVIGEVIADLATMDAAAADPDRLRSALRAGWPGDAA